MNAGIKILCERMASNPDDFRHQKWRRLIVRALSNRGGIFTDEECDAINNSIIGLERRLFEGDVMEALAPPAHSVAGHVLVSSTQVTPYDDESTYTLSEMVERAMLQRLEKQAHRTRLLKGQTEEAEQCTTG